jgi:hypothetical protein
MTMRVYRVSPDGRVTEIRGRVSVIADENMAPLLTNQYPPCRCPRHRPDEKARTR